MILWSIQTIAAWQELRTVGVLRGDSRFVYAPFLPAYQWMAQQMQQRIGPPPYPTALPVWAWYQWNTRQHPRPDLRVAGHLPAGTRGVRIACAIPPARVLLSDFELWHYVLNGWYLPLSLADQAAFEQEAAAYSDGYALEGSSLPTHLHAKIVTSWQRVLDLDWAADEIARPTEHKAMQATFWELRLADVKNIQEFVAR